MNTSTTRRPALSAATSVSNRRVTIALLVAAVFFYWMALYLYVPTLPTYVQNKTADLALVGVVLAQYGLWQAVVRLPLGIAADWLGWRKPFIVVGLVLTGLGALTMGRSANVTGILVGRAITGLAASTWVPLVVTFSSLFPPDEAVRASALLTFVGSVGQVLATSLTGWLNGLGGYGLAFSLAAGAAALAILVVLPAREGRRPPKRPSVQGVSRLVSRRDVLVPSLLAAISQYAGWAGTFGFLPILARQLGATDVTQSILVSMNIGVVTLGNLAATGVVNRFGPRWRFSPSSRPARTVALRSGLPYRAWVGWSPGGTCSCPPCWLPSASTPVGPAPSAFCRSWPSN